MIVHRKFLLDSTTSWISELLEGQVEDLKERLEKADTEKAHLLELVNNLQKQNEILMLPSPHKKQGSGDTSA